MPDRTTLKTHARLAVVLGVLLGGAAGSSLLFADQKQSRKLTDREAAVHVLNRLAFGPTQGQVDVVTKIGWQQWVEQQLQPDKIDDSALDKKLAERCPSVKMNLAQILENYVVPPPKKMKEGDLSPEEQKKLMRERNERRKKIKEELNESVLLRATESQRQFQEVMIEFWRNHLSIDSNKERVLFLAANYEENVLRKHAFGKFEDLILASAKHPAMLIFLDNHVSTKKGLNENYARELMELHTLGVDNEYKQQDVIELARVLTGWSVERKVKKDEKPEVGFIFREFAHDNSPATVVGLKLDGKGGVKDGEKAIRHLANHKGTAHFISFKLCRYLVNDNPPKELVERVAQVFLKTGGNLPDVYRAIILSPEFMDAANYKAKFKTPFEFVISSMRATGTKVESIRGVSQGLRAMGQPIYECDVPTGYYDQAESWLDPGVMVYRWNAATQLVNNKVPGLKVPASLRESLEKLPKNEQAKKVMETFLPDSKDAKLEQLLAREKDVRTMIALALGSADFQQQ